jgi:hypothetical protein
MHGMETKKYCDELLFCRKGGEMPGLPKDYQRLKQDIVLWRYQKGTHKVCQWVCRHVSLAAAVNSTIWWGLLKKKTSI